MAFIVAFCPIPVAIDEVRRDVQRRFILVVGGLLAIPSHAVPYSIFGLGIADYVLYGVFLPVFLLGLVRLVFITCPQRCVHEDIALIFVLTRCTDYTVDGYHFSIPFCQILTYLWPTLMLRYDPSCRGKRLRLSLRSKALSWRGCY